MRTKNAVDWDTREIVLKYIRRYDDYTEWLEEERRKLMSVSPQQYDRLDMPGTMEASSSIEIAVIRLEELETCHKAQVVKAIERARYVFLALEESDNREMMLNKIWLSCIERKKYNYESNFAGLFISRRSFFRKKGYFIQLIAENLGLL